MAEYPQIGVRVDPDFLKLVDEWRRKQADLPSRPEAIRRLVEQALQRPKGQRAKQPNPEPNFTPEPLDPANHPD